jgi:hypothetical protein
VVLGNKLVHRREILDTKCGKCTQACFLETGIAKQGANFLKFALNNGSKNEQRNYR